MKINDAFRFNGSHKCGAKFSVFASYQWDPSREALPQRRNEWGNMAFVRVDFWRADDGREFSDCAQGGIVYVCTCGVPCRARPVLGKYNPGKACNAKCQASTGHQCECSCRGKNHGAGHEVRA